MHDVVKKLSRYLKLPQSVYLKKTNCQIMPRDMNTSKPLNGSFPPLFATAGSLLLPVSTGSLLLPVSTGSLLLPVSTGRNSETPDCDHLCKQEGREEGNVLFNDLQATFYLQEYGFSHRVKDDSYVKRGNPLPLPYVLLFLINSKGVLYAPSHRG